MTSGIYMEPVVKIDQNDTCCDFSETTNPEVRTTHYATVSPTTTRHVADARFDKRVRLVMLYLQIVVGSLGGILVFAWLWKNRRRKSRVNVIIGNLATADILVISFACVMQLIWEHFDRLWLAGNALCKLFKYVQSLSIMSSVNMLVVLSIDRHQAIRLPLRRPIPVRHLVGAGWTLASVLSLPQLGVFGVNTVGNRTLCESMFRGRPIEERRAYLTFINVIVFLLPTIVMLTCYVRIFTKIASKAAEANEGDASAVPTSSSKPSPTHRRISSRNSNDRCSSSATRKGTSSWRGSKSKSVKVCLHSTQSGSLPRAKIKSLKMAVVVVSMFIVCSAPYHVLEMIYSYGSHSSVPSAVAGVFGAMAVANSTMNPFVFLFFNVDAFGCRRSHPGRHRHTSGQNNQPNHHAPHPSFPLHSRQPQLIAVDRCRRGSLGAVADKADCSTKMESSQAAPGAAVTAVVAANSLSSSRTNRGRPTDDLQDDVTETAVSMTVTSTVVQHLELGEDD